MIAKCNILTDFDTIYEIINDASIAYKGIIPEDRWHEPYMPKDELQTQINEKVEFWKYVENETILGVMGIQYKGDVTLIRHAYVRTMVRQKGIGGQLLEQLISMSKTPVLIGTWADADWAIRFYLKHGFHQVSKEDKNRLLRIYWSIPERQVETSIVLASENFNLKDIEMNKFANALIAEKKHPIIPQEYDYFGHFVGEWSFKWHDNIGTPNESICDGTWTFSRVLEGRAIQDTFVTSKKNPQTGELEDEYGTTIRIYNPAHKNWDIFYGCTGEACQLIAEKDEDKIMLTCVTPIPFRMKWIFYDIQQDSFKWKNIQSVDGGKTWKIKAQAEEAHRVL